MVKVYKIIEKTNVEGPNTRFCIWVQGCNKHCLGCFAKDTWDFNKGKDISIENLYSKILSMKSQIEGVTFLGGEPFEQAKELSELSKFVKAEGLSIVCFTGYTIEELKTKKDIPTNKFLAQIDLLIDGGFEKDKYDLSRAWIGSSNQRYIFLTDFYSQETIKQYKNKIEIRVKKNGQLGINGMGDFDKINKDFCLQLGKNKLK
jgi:anaerobic ribonucleoside-triphosphate reductase activating protein